MIIYKLVISRILWVGILLILSLNLLAQKWEVGGSIGVNQYKGDVVPKFKPLIARPAGSGFVRMNLSRAVSIKAQAMYGSVTGDDRFMSSDPYHQAREYHFKADLAEGSAQIEYNFLNFRTNASRIVNNWTPYVFGGYGATYIQSKAFLKTDINPTVFTPYSTRKAEQVAILGIGFKKQWKDRWNWGVEFGARHTTSDYIDNLGYSDGKFQILLPAGVVPSNPKFQYLLKYQIPGTKAKDIYYYTNFSISYIIYKVYCPRPRR